MKERNDILLLFDTASQAIASGRKRLDTAGSDVSFASVATELAKRTISDFTAIMARLEKISGSNSVDVPMHSTDPTDRY